MVVLVVLLALGHQAPPHDGLVWAGRDPMVSWAGGFGGEGSVAPPSAVWPYGSPLHWYQTAQGRTTAAADMVKCHATTGVSSIDDADDWFQGPCHGLARLEATHELLVLSIDAILWRVPLDDGNAIGAVNLSAIVPNYQPGTLVAWETSAETTIGVAATNNTLVTFEVGDFQVMGRPRNPRLYEFPWPIRGGAMPHPFHLNCFLHDSPYVPVACYHPSRTVE